VPSITLSLPSVSEAEAEAEAEATEARSTVHEQDLAVGLLVIARFKGQHLAWCPGKVGAFDTANGTYRIDYDDGDVEEGVARIRIKTPGQAEKGLIEANTRCEACVPGSKPQAPTVPGVVTSANGDGTYSVRFDDGAVAMDIERKKIYVLSVTPPPRKTSIMPQQSKPDLAVGDAVAARFGGGPDFYFGEITAVLDDGTYNISYADGDHEEGVKRLRIKGKEDQMPTVLVEGMRCEARHGGSMRAFDGVISKVNSDGTYDVGYDDGDKETGVARELIYVQAVAEPSWSAESDGSFSPEATEAIHRIFATFNASASSEGKWGMAEFNAFQEALAEDPMQTEEEFSGVCGSLEVKQDASGRVGAEALVALYAQTDGLREDLRVLGLLGPDGRLAPARKAEGAGV